MYGGAESGLQNIVFEKSTHLVKIVPRPTLELHSLSRLERLCDGSFGPTWGSGLSRALLCQSYLFPPKFPPPTVLPCPGMFPCPGKPSSSPRNSYLAGLVLDSALTGAWPMLAPIQRRVLWECLMACFQHPASAVCLYHWCWISQDWALSSNKI